MSHVTRVQTQMTDKACVRKALEDLGLPVCENQAMYWFEDGVKKQAIMDFVAMPDDRWTNAIPLQKVGATYHVLTDSDEFPQVFGKHFIARLTQRYAYHATRAELQRQGFEVRSEENHDGTIRLLLSRLVLGDGPMELHEITSRIDRAGEVTLAVSGMPGTTCLDATKGLEEVLGARVVERVMMPPEEAKRTATGGRKASTEGVDSIELLHEIIQSGHRQ